MTDPATVARLFELHAKALREADQASESAPGTRELLVQLGQWLHATFGATSQVIDWGDVPIGGGGYITNIARDPHTGTLFAGTDVQNGYLRRPGDRKWATIFRADTMQPEDMERGSYTDEAGDTYRIHDMGHGLACSMGDWAGTDGTRFYSHIAASVYTIDLDPNIPLTETGGIKCRKWNLPPKWMQPNLGQGKFQGEGIAGHPTDKNTALVGTWNDGCYYTTDAGSTVHEIAVPKGFGSAKPEKGRERYLVAIDPSNPSNCYIFAQGTGLHRSTNGVAGPYKLVEGGPRMAFSLYHEPDGTLWICGDGRIPNEDGSKYVKGLSPDAGLWMLEGDTTTFAGNPLVRWSYFPYNVAVDPHDRNRMMCWMEQLGGISFDRGATWTYMDHPSEGSIFRGGEAKWRIRNGVFMSGGFVFTDQPGEVIGGEGFGIIRAENLWTPQPHPDSPDGSTKYRLIGRDMSAGIEEFIVNYIFVNPTNGRLFLNSWDRHVTEVTELDAYTARAMQPKGARLSICHGMDNAIDAPDYYVASGGSGTPSHSWSEGGEEWFLFADTMDERKIAYPDSDGRGSAGAIAMSERDDIVICQSNNFPAIECRKERDPKTGLPVFRQIELNGSTNYNTINSYTTAYRKNVSADKTRPGVFAMVVPMTNPSIRNVVNNPLGGLWVRDGIDAEWRQTVQGVIGSYGEKAQFWNADLKYIPGHPGQLLYTGYINQADCPLMHLLNDGRDVIEIENVRNVTKYGFGLNPGQDYPAVMFFGNWKSERGYWLTLDWFKSAVKLSDIYPNNYWTTGYTAIAGDMSPGGFGKWFVSCAGKGAVYAVVR